MTKIDLQYDLINYTPASASPVEANFDRAEQHINQELIERDGTVAMRAQLKLVGDPVAELDAAPKQYVDQVLPIGIIMMFGGATVPPGGRWAICNGAELQTATYPALYAVIGTNFGGSAGRFNLPNMINRVPMGSGGTAALGAVGGNADATLVAHAHAGGTHAHGMENHNHGMKNHVHHFNHFHGLGAGATAGRNAAHTHGTNVPVYYWQDGTGWEWGVTTGQGSQIPMNKGHVGTDTESADHAHTLVGSTVYNNQAGSGGVGSGEGGNGNTYGPNDNITDLASAHNTLGAYSGDTDTRGSAATNANLPPYVGVSYIMRVL